MYAVIFEVEVKRDGKERYLGLASKLRKELENLDGFISIERFQSLADEGKILSLSFWESAEAIANWRNKVQHKEAQQEGMRELFGNYRIRVAKVERDYGMSSRDQTPK